MFETFRCESCVHGEFDIQIEEWECLLDIEYEDDDKQQDLCEQNYEDDESN